MSVLRIIGRALVEGTVGALVTLVILYTVAVSIWGSAVLEVRVIP